MADPFLGSAIFQPFKLLFRELFSLNGALAIKILSDSVFVQT